MAGHSCAHLALATPTVHELATEIQFGGRKLHLFEVLFSRCEALVDNL